MQYVLIVVICFAVLLIVLHSLIIVGNMPNVLAFEAFPGMGLIFSSSIEALRDPYFLNAPNHGYACFLSYSRACNGPHVLNPILFSKP